MTNATMPVRVALPVVASTKSGIARFEKALPVFETNEDEISAKYERR